MFLIEFLFPLCFRLLAIFAGIATLVAACAIAPLYVVIELAMSFGGNFVSVHDSIKVRSFKAVWEFRGLFGLFVVGPASKVRLVG